MWSDMQLSTTISDIAHESSGHERASATQSRNEVVSEPTEDALDAMLSQLKQLNLTGHISYESDEVMPNEDDSAWQLSQTDLGRSPHGGVDDQQLHGSCIPPLARDRFLVMLQDWWRRTGIEPDTRMITIGNHQIDMHQLHSEVVQCGGAFNVRRRDSWNDITARMGWTPTRISEAGRTQVQIAEQFKLVYEQLLESFEVEYMSAAMKESPTAQSLQTADQQGSTNTGSNQPSGPNRQLSVQQAMHMIKLGHMSVEQMRTAGYPENIIQCIDQNRPALQATWRRMQMQRLNQQQQQQRQQGAAFHPSLLFQNQHQAQTAMYNSPTLQPQGVISGANALRHPGFSTGSSQSNVMPAQQSSQPDTQSLTPQNIQMHGILSNLRKPTTETIKHAFLVFEQMKQDISKERRFRPEHVRHLSDIERGAFPGHFEVLCNAINDVYSFMHLYLVSTNDVNVVRGFLKMYDLCDKQRQLVQSANPIYVLDIAILQKLTETAIELRIKVLLVVQQLRIMSQADQESQAHAVMQQQQRQDPN